LREPTVLIIDDDPSNLAVMASILEDRHYTILVAEDSERGLKRARHARPDLILLDIIMPQIDGYETCRRLQAAENTRDIPVIFMTALVEPEHKLKGFEAGAVDYITKPFQRGEVLARVGVHLRIRDLTSRLQEEKDSLEIRIRERTAELTRLNNELQEEIAERKRSELAFLESEKKYRNLIETTRDLVFIVDRRGNFNFVNPMLEWLTGYSASELVGRSFTDIVAPEFREVMVDRFKRGIKGEVTPPYEVELVDKAGGRFLVEFQSTTLMDHNGKPTGRFGVGRDITERKRTEVALREGERRLSDIIDFFPDPILAINQDKRIIIWNRAIEEMTGVPAQEMIGKGDYAYTVPFYGVARPQLMDLFWEPEHKVAAKYPFIRKEGDNLVIEVFCPALYGGRGAYVWAKASPLRDGEGRLIGAIECIQDISERKQVEKESQDMLTFLQTLIDTIPSSIFYKDIDGIYRGCNKAFEDFLGVKKEEIVGKSVYDMYPPDLADKYHEMDSILFRQQEKQVYEHQIIYADGSRHDVIFNKASYLNADGTIAGLVGVMVDISERKQAEVALQASEEKYRNIYENALEGIFQTTPDGRLLSVNPAFAKMYGYASSQEMINHIMDIKQQVYVDPEEREKYKEILAKQGIVEGFQVQHYKKDREKFWVSINARVLSDEAGKAYYSGFVEDITKRRLAEEEKIHLEARLRQAQKMEAIGTLAGGIAHDFNNILSAIMGYTDMALRSLPENETLLRRYLNQVFKAGERASDLVKQILAFSRQGDEKPCPLRVSIIVKEALKLLRATLPSTIQIHQDIQSEWDTVLADPTQIHQIVMNLCTNAAHAMRERQGELKVSLVTVDVDRQVAQNLHHDLIPGAYLKLTVSDTGIGIPVEIRDRIFDPFFTTKKPQEGTGMGLAIVYGIVSSYNGAIAVESEVGRGSAFHVYLPLLAETEIKENTAVVMLPQGRKERLLFVDDEEVIVQLGMEMLTDLGYEVTGKTSSVDAWELFRSRPDLFDLVITDMTMPDMTGIDLAKNMAHLRPDIPVILCSGFSEEITPERLKAAGIGDFIMKPILKHKIAVAIRCLLDNRK